MKRLCTLAVVMCLVLGCAGEGDKAQWDEFWKDARGDNMKMRTGNWGGEELHSPSTLKKASD